MTYDTADTLHRLMKQLLDTGAASSVAEAKAIFAGYKLCFVIEDVAARNRHHQAALLTGVALASRVFLGGVDVVAGTDTLLVTPLPLGRTLHEAIRRLGGRVVESRKERTPTIFVGAEAGSRAEGFQMRTAYCGWRAAALPLHADFEHGEDYVVALAPMAAAAFAVSEAYFFVQGQTKIAGKRPMGLSLWNPAGRNWQRFDRTAPRLEFLPSRLWLIGLGHLGQAFLWALSLLPYSTPAEVSLVLQDIDKVTPSTPSTSILTDASMVGKKKARTCASWAEDRGFSTAITERMFDELCKRSDVEPTVALCGLDNALGRRALDGAGFDFIVEAGLGRGHRDFRTMRLHTLPASRPASSIWNAAPSEEDLTGRAAYKNMLDSGELDRCGVTLLAGKAVGAPFVGATAACLAIAEVLRLLHGGSVHELLDFDLQSPEQILAVTSARDFASLNPGYVSAQPGG